MIQFTAKEKAAMTEKIRNYAEREWEYELGRFEAEAFVEFLHQNIGAYYYNRGIFDAQTILASRVEDIQDAIANLEKPTER
ncbi:MAG: DUF2164 domain-containing protein [Candidatus Kapaibacterium sp.]|nr:MAG: DUF2164 domain-containing protein [Candidatus Kapabacteria bacterium]